MAVGCNLIDDNAEKIEDLGRNVYQITVAQERRVVAFIRVHSGSTAVTTGN